MPALEILDEFFPLLGGEILEDFARLCKVTISFFKEWPVLRRPFLVVTLKKSRLLGRRCAGGSGWLRRWILGVTKCTRQTEESKRDKKTYCVESSSHME